MPKARRPFAEALLAAFAGRERAAAIYGDLAELAAVRGGTWFWMAYARTVAALTWRPAAGFVAGYAIFVILYRLRLDLLRHTPRALRGEWFSRPFLFQPLFLVAVQAWFLAPFAAARFGIHDRFVQIVLAVSLLISGAFLVAPASAVFLLLIAMLALTVTASFASMKWRRTGLTLVATLAAGATTLGSLLPVARLGEWYYRTHGVLGRHFFVLDHGFAGVLPFAWASMLLDMLVLVTMCSWLHGRLARGGRTAAA